LNKPKVEIDDSYHELQTPTLDDMEYVKPSREEERQFDLLNSDPQDGPMDAIHQIMILYVSKYLSISLVVKSRYLVTKECSSI